MYVPDVTKFLTDAPLLYTTFPLLLVAQPANVYPVFVNPLLVNVQFASYVQALFPVDPPVFPFPLNVIV